MSLYRVFEIATQFNAIFRAQANAQQVSVSLLSMWTSRRVHSFLGMLKTQLNRMEDSASLRDALDACVFFAASMGRLGADFTAQLPALFENKMHALVVHFWKEGANQLADTLKVCRDAGIASPLSSSMTANTNLQTEAAASGENGPLPPPRQLMANPPLGRLVNSFVTGLNELRRCLLPGIFSRLRQSLDELLREVDAILSTNERAVMTPGLRGEAAELRIVAKEMKEIMADLVEPYMRGALEFSLGNEDAARDFHEKLKLKEGNEEDADAEFPTADQVSEEVKTEADDNVDTDAANLEVEEPKDGTGGDSDNADAHTDDDDALTGEIAGDD